MAYRYLPIIAIRIAEMNALYHLPEKDKDQMLPMILVGRWGASNSLEGSTAKISKVFGGRPWIADIDDEFFIKSSNVSADKRRLVHDEMDSLRDPRNGYENWVSFVASQDNVYPTLQLEDLGQLDSQIKSFVRLDRQVVVRFTEESIQAWGVIFTALSRNGVTSPIVVLDYSRVGQKKRADLLLDVAVVSAYIDQMAATLPKAVFAPSSTTFPTSFTDIGLKVYKIDIYERAFFNALVAQSPTANFIYSDRASVSPYTKKGGSGSPPARIDYPLKDRWAIARRVFDEQKNKPEQNKRNKVAAYEAAAKIITQDSDWAKAPAIWGVKEIEATSKGTHISSAGHATSVRINIHMFQQLYYQSPQGDVIDTDEDWLD